MKAHKYWSLGALACMAGCFYTGCKKLMQAHKWEYPKVCVNLQTDVR